MWHHVYWFIRPDLNQLPIPSNQSFLDHWQTLIGSALGAVLTIVGSVYASKRDARIKESATELTARKEAFRKIEISCVMSLEDVIMCVEQLHIIHGLIQEIVEEVKRTPSTVFAIHETNIPLTRNLYRDPELAMLKTKSSYLHNKLIIINRLLKGANDTIDDLKQDYSDLLKRNRFIIELESRKSQPVPAHQQEAYIQGLVAFSESLIIYAEREFPHILRVIEQVIVYERLLARDFEKTKEEYEPEDKKSLETDTTDQHPLDLVDTIDERIHSDVEKIHTQIRTRLEKNREERGRYVV